MNTTISIWAIPATIVATVAVFTFLGKVYKSTFGRRRYLRRSLVKLACGTTLAHIETFLGQPISSEVGDDGRVHRVYRTAYAFVVATTPGPDRNIDAFSITIRRRKCRKRLKLLTSGHTAGNLKIDLSKSTFGMLPAQTAAQGCRCIIGANRFGYTEIFYFGNPGYYQTYLLSYNDAAGDGPPVLPSLASYATGDLFDPEQDEDLKRDPPPPGPLAEFRNSLRINTLTVLDPRAALRSLMTYLGPGVDNNSVRQIPE